MRQRRRRVINGDQYITVRVVVVNQLHRQYLPLAFIVS